SAYTRSSFFPMTGVDEVDTYIRFRDNMLELKKHHRVDLNVAQLEQAVWVIYEVQRHLWGDPRETRAVIKEYKDDVFIRGLKVAEIDLMPCLGTEDCIAKGLFLETYNPRDAGKFYGEALEAELGKLMLEKPGKDWNLDPRPFRDKLGDLVACHPKLAEHHRRLINTWKLRNACVHPRLTSANPPGYFHNIVQEILAVYRLVREIGS
ncbi:MAG: hypothetical protein WC943_03310, partial [Elusimicrobiota bacterium]